MRLFDDNSLATAVIWQEARGEIREGKIAVGEVIRRRTKLKYSSDGTIAGTIFRPWQFSGMNTEDRNRIAAFKLDYDDPVVRDCAEAWVESEWTDHAKGGVLYHATWLKPPPYWVRKSLEVARIGHHIFYVEL